MFIGPILRQNLDTAKLLAFPEAEFLIPIMVAVNDFTLHDTIVSGVQTALSTHRYNKDLDENEIQLLEAQLELLNRHQFGLIWECLELLNELETKAPTIIEFFNSFDEIKTIYELVKPYCKSNKLRRIRNNLSFHFGVSFMKEALKTVQSHQTMVLKTQIGDNFWYEVASEAQAHLLTRTITKLVNDTSTTDDVVKKANEQGLLMKALKLNLICLFKTVIEHRIEPLYLPLENS